MGKHEIPKIEGEVRDRVGTRYAARLRAQHRLPGVIYGHKQDPVHVSFEARQFIDLLQRKAHVMEVVYDSRAESCLVKAVQWDYLGTHIVHVDLARVDLKERVTTDVMLELHGEAVGLKETGAMLEHPYTTIPVECEAGNIPQSVHADISELEVGKPLIVADVEIPEGVTCTLSPKTVLASITIVAVVAEEEPEASEELEAESAEPEVISARKEEQGEVEAEAEAKAKAKKE